MQIADNTSRFHEDISAAAYALIQRIDTVVSASQAIIKVWVYRYTSRRELAGMDNRMLADIGLTHADVRKEMNKPFWRD